MNFDYIIQCVAEERQRQEAKWGKQSHDDPLWALILSEEVGEVSEAILRNSPQEDMVMELIQVMAVAAAWLESLADRDERRADYVTSLQDTIAAQATQLDEARQVISDHEFTIRNATYMTPLQQDRDRLAHELRLAQDKIAALLSQLDSQRRYYKAK